MELVGGLLALLLGIFLIGIALTIVKFTLTAIFNAIIALGGFLLVSGLVFYALNPLLERTVNLSQGELWTIANTLGVGLVCLLFLTQRKGIMRKYGLLAIALTFLMTTLPLWFLYETSNPGIQNLQTSLGITPLSSTTLTLYAVFVPYWISINLATFVFYALDKQIAIIFPKDQKADSELPFIQKIGRSVSRTLPFIRPSRIPEKILHWHSYFGGSFGASLARNRNYLNHKSSKEPFGSIFRRTVWMQIAGLVAIFFVTRVQMAA